MKKIFIFIIILLNFNFALAIPTQSTNEFPLELNDEDIPSGNCGSSGGGGLSGGAVTAITLGSIGVLGLGGIGYWIYNKYFTQGLTTGCAVGIDFPLMPICIDKSTVDKLLAKNPSYCLLKKALAQDEIRECPHSKYILVPDTEIKNNTFNTIIFENSKPYSHIRVTQANLPNIDGLKVELYYDENQKEEINLKTVKSNSTEGILIKEGQLNDSKNAALFVTYKNINKNISNQKYALVIEFFK